MKTELKLSNLFTKHKNFVRNLSDKDFINMTTEELLTDAWLVSEVGYDYNLYAHLFKVGNYKVVINRFKIPNTTNWGIKYFIYIPKIGIFSGDLVFNGLTNVTLNTKMSEFKVQVSDSYLYNLTKNNVNFGYMEPGVELTVMIDTLAYNNAETEPLTLEDELMLRKLERMVREFN